MLSAQCKRIQVHMLYMLLFTLVSAMSQVILMLRTYAFFGRKRRSRYSFGRFLQSCWRYYLGYKQRDNSFVLETLFFNVYS